MSTEVTVAVVAGTLTALGGGALAVLNSTIARRSGIDDGLRSLRLEVYPRLWALSGTFSRWPQQSVTRAALEDLQGRLRDWYYIEGGLFLTARARERYGDLQALIETVLDRGADPSAVLRPERYADLRETASALRTAMTDDLDTRRRRSRSQDRERDRWHAAQSAMTERRQEAALTDPDVFTPPDGPRS